MSELLMWILGIDAVLIVLSIITKNQILWFLTKLSVGPLAIILLNHFLPSYAININYFTIGFTGVLGLPGVMTLYLLQMIL